MSASDKTLRIYLNDHLGGATAGVGLARRARDNSTDAERTAMWREICEEVEADREVLLSMLERLDFSPNPVKVLLGWAGEKLGRLKPNGHLDGPTELGQLIELEALSLGVQGKLSLWKNLAAAGDPRLEEFDLDDLIRRAESQFERLEDHRIALGAEIFGRAAGVP